MSYGFNYGAGDNGDVLSVTATGAQTFNRSYGYDNLNRLMTMSAPGDTCSGLSWTVDPWGNRTDQTVTGGTCNTFHQPVSGNNQFSNSPYQYDAAGNLINDGAHTYTYDAENRLTQVDGGATATYVYDVNGVRVRKAAGSAWWEYFYGVDGNVDGEMNQDGWLVYYVYLGDRLIVQYRDDTTYFFQSDHLGSTRLLTGLTGSVCESIDYLPFGEYASLTGTCSTTHQFTGKERDSESGLDNFGARYMSSQYGRFMTPDPMGGQLANPQSLNRYAYVTNNPLNMIDPTGMSGENGDPFHGCEEVGFCDAIQEGDWGFGPGYNGPTTTGGSNFSGGYCDASSSGCGGFGSTYSPDGAQIDLNTAMNELGTGSGALCPAPAGNCKFTDEGLFAWGGMYRAITADYFNGSLKNVEYLTEINWIALGNGAILPEISYTSTFIFPVFFGLGPAITISYIPGQNLRCVAPGVGASVGRTFSAGPITGESGAIRGTLSGWSFSGGYQFTS